MPLFTNEEVITNTPLTVDGSGVTQPVSGTVTANAGTGTFTVDGSGVTQPVSGTVTANAGTGTFTVDGSGVTQPVSGTVTANAGTGTFTVDGSGVTQPVSGTVTANAGTGTFAVSGTVTANAGTGTFTVDGSGVTQPVSGTVTANAGTGTFAVSEAGATTTTALAQIVLVANTNATVLSSNASRLGAILFIPTAAIGNPVYVKFGTTASATSYTYKVVASNTTVEFPKAWLGRIDIFAVTAQTINITEF